MNTVIKNPRSGCGLHGALQTVTSIKGAVPIVHSNGGCSVQNYYSNKAGGGYAGSISGESIPGTAVQERHVIFGGASRLREQIKNTVKVVNGELYVVLNSCESAMVGDDIDAMTREATEQGEPIIDSLIAGFHGDAHYGYENVLADIVKKLPAIIKPGNDADKKKVNVFGIIPQQNVFFRGDLYEIKRILEGIGLSVNIFFGSENGVKEFAEAPEAALNISFSKWGEKVADTLGELYTTPSLKLEAVPLGIKEVRAFVDKLSEKTEIDKEKAERFLKAEEEKLHNLLEPVAETFYDDDLAKDIIIIGDEETVIRFSGFLKNELGAVIETAVITDFFPENDTAVTEKTAYLSSVAENVYFSHDSSEIESIISDSNADIVLGSSLDDVAAEKISAAKVHVSYPVYDTAVLGKTYAGINGAVSLTEDYITAIKENNRSKEKGFIEFINE